MIIPITRAYMHNYIIDIDGTVIDSNKAINRSVAFIKTLQEKNCEFLLATNSIKSHEQQQKRLQKHAISVSKAQIYTPIDAINNYIRQQNIVHVWVIGSYLEIEQIDAKQTASNAELIILLDFEKDNLAYQNLQTIVNKIALGCKVITASRSPYYLINKQKHIDTGAFVRLLESVTGIQIPVFGKPSLNYYYNALQHFSDKSAQTYMIGDDWQTDIIGANKAGLKTVGYAIGKVKTRYHLNDA